MEDKDKIVLCEPLTLEKFLVYQVPAFHFGATFREFSFLSEHGMVILLSKHMVGLLSFSALQKGKMAKATETIPVEHEVPKPMFIFGKEISIEASLHKWEESLTTNTLTNYDEQISKQALRMSAKNSTVPVASTPMAASASYQS